MKAHRCKICEREILPGKGGEWCRECLRAWYRVFRPSADLERDRAAEWAARRARWAARQ